jgi:cobalt/nickel transport system permease protein
MHVPDGVLPLSECATLAIVAVAGFALAARGASMGPRDTRLPTIGLLAATVFVLQMLNFPLFGPVSAHLMGTSLVVYVAGFDAAVLAMAPVLLLQAFLLHDGGLVALGANYVNIALVPAIVSSTVISFTGARSRSRPAIAVGAATMLGTLAGAATCAIDLAWSGIVPMRTAFAWIMPVQAAAGLVEAALTGAVVHHFARRAHVAPESPARWRSAAPWIAVLIVAAMLVPIASGRPDALQYALRVAPGFGAAR